MPSGYVPPFPLSREADSQPDLALRLRVRLGSRHLDAQLADGQDRSTNDELWLRAAQLREPKNRQALARTIDRLLELVDPGTEKRLGIMRVPIKRDAIWASRPYLVELAERLRSAGPHGVRGLAMASVVLRDGAGPLYAPDDPGHLQAAVRSTLDAIHP